MDPPVISREAAITAIAPLEWPSLACWMSTTSTSSKTMVPPTAAAPEPMAWLKTESCSTTVPPSATRTQVAPDSPTRGLREPVASRSQSSARAPSLRTSSPQP